MAITIEDTKSANDANSYASVLDFDEFVSSRFGLDELFELDDDTKAKLLISATDDIERLNFVFDRYVGDQALRLPINWLNPATGQYEEAGYPQAKQACILQAIYVYNNKDMIDQAISASVNGTLVETVRGNSQTRACGGFNWFKRFDSKVYSLLSKYIDISMTVNKEESQGAIQGRYNYPGLWR